MKSITKFLTAILLVILSLSFSLAACSDPKTEKTSAKAIIKESIAEIESSVFTTDTTSGITPMAYVAPNSTVGYALELQSILRGCGMGLYTADYVATYFDDFKTDTVYLDDSISQLTFLFKAENSDTGVNSTLEMNNGNSKNQIRTYFNYDYSLNKPTNTTITMLNGMENAMTVAIAHFDYLNDIAYSFELSFSCDDISAVNTQLLNGTFTFEQFISCNVVSYKLAKINLENKNIQSYVFNIGDGSDNLSATQEQVGALYNEIYNDVKGACKPTVYLDTSNATEKVYYSNLYAYISSKTAVLVDGEDVISTFITYENAKSYLTILTNELSKTDYSASTYDNAKSALAECLAYVNSISKKDYCGVITADGMITFTSPQIVTEANAISYLFTNIEGTVSIRFAIKNNELVSIAFAN